MHKANHRCTSLTVPCSADFCPKQIKLIRLQVLLKPAQSAIQIRVRNSSIVRATIISAGASLLANFKLLWLTRISHSHLLHGGQVVGWLRRTAQFDPQRIDNTLPVKLFVLLASQPLTTAHDEVSEKCGLVHGCAVETVPTSLCSIRYSDPYVAHSVCT